MAELYIARQQAMGGFEKPVVLKLLQPRYAEKASVVTMFLDEARLAAKLNHPSIVHVYDVADGRRDEVHRDGVHPRRDRRGHREAGARGRELSPARARGPPGRPDAAGLAYAHERREPDGRVLRIVHRDVSPTNILVSYEGQTKIVDFGIARAQDELREESGILPGKASYMSPEQIRGQGADYRSDIFALGIILYELTLCQRLYRGAPEAVMRRIVDENITPPTAIKRDYPPALELIVMRALEKRPEDRYQSAEAMRHELEEFLDDSGLRTGNRRVSLYMNELFPSVAGRNALPDPQPGAEWAGRDWKSWTSIAARRYRCGWSRGRGRSDPASQPRPPRRRRDLRSRSRHPRLPSGRNRRPRSAR